MTSDLDLLLALWLGFTGYCLFSIRLSLARLVKLLDEYLERRGV
jgi:hypothetical protein